MAEPNYICNELVPCSLRAWNNFAGYTKYKSRLPNHEDSLAYFLTLVPSNSSTVTIPSHYFHIIVPWIEHIHCEALFIIKDSHIYVIKRSGNEWLALDYPHTHVYMSIIDISIQLQNVQYIVVLFPNIYNQIFKVCVQLWNPKQIPYYMNFKRELLYTVSKYV